MKRCSICDSTIQYDTLQSLGLAQPITKWFTDERYGDTCNRCHNSAQDALFEMEDENDQQD